MKLLDQFIAQAGKQPADWTSQDIQQYLDYVKEHVTEVTMSKRHDAHSARQKPENISHRLRFPEAV
jgi:hypothetical protein